MTLDDVLLRLLEKMEVIGQQHEELFDSEVRERMGIAIMDGFVRRQHGYQIPDDLGMASEEANHAVQSSVKDYIDGANAEAELLGITKFHDRLTAFQNGGVRTAQGRRDYEDFFGHTPPEFYAANGTVLRTQ